LRRGSSGSRLRGWSLRCGCPLTRPAASRPGLVLSAGWVRAGCTRPRDCERCPDPGADRSGPAARCWGPVPRPVPRRQIRGEHGWQRAPSSGSTARRASASSLPTVGRGRVRALLRDPKRRVQEPRRGLARVLRPESCHLASVTPPVAR
jgi:hypothetical protein